MNVHISITHNSLKVGTTQMSLICWTKFYIYIYVYICVYIYIYTHIHIYTHIYTHIHIYIHTHTHTHTHTHIKLYQCRRHKRCSGFNPWVGKILWRRKWQSTPVFLPGESHGQRGEPGGLQPIGLQRVRHHWGDLTHSHNFMKYNRIFSPIKRIK